MAAKVRQIEEDRLSMISRMSQMVVNIPKRDITEVKSLASPPVGVKDTLEAALILLGAKDTSWREIKKYLGQIGKDSLQKQIEAIDPETITEERRSKAREILNKYSQEEMCKISKATVAFYSWVKAVAED